MATYILLMNFTDQGIRNVKQSPKRGKAAIASSEKLGIKTKDIYWTMGAYDLVSIVDAANDAAMTTLALSVSSQGNVRTQTMRAYSANEMGKILANVP